MSTNPHDPNGYDAGNRRHVERRIKRSKIRNRQLDDALRWLMADQRGRMLMWERLAEAGVFRTSMGTTPEQTAFREGRRDMGLRDLVAIMRLCPEQYTRMAAEAQADQPTPHTGDDHDERDE